MSTRSLLLFCALPLFVLLERASHYTARSNLAIYLASPPPEGLGLPTTSISAYFATLSAFSIASPIVGGLLAIGIGPAATLIFGAFIAAAGYAVLGTGDAESLTLALALIAAGTGMCRPSGLAVAAAELRGRSENIQRALFFLIYVGVGVGALLGPLGAGLVGAVAGRRVLFGMAAGIALLAAFLGAGLFVTLRYTNKNIDASPPPAAPAPSGGAVAAGVILLWIALAPSLIMQSAEATAQFTLFGGPSSITNTVLQIINPVVGIAVSLAGGVILLVLSGREEQRIPVLAVIGAGLIAWALASGALAAAPRGGDFLPVLVVVSAISAAGEAVVQPLALWRAAASSSPRFSALVVAGWLAGWGALSSAGYAIAGVANAQLVTAVAAALTLVAGGVLLAVARPMERAFFPRPHAPRSP